VGDPAGFGIQGTLVSAPQAVLPPLSLEFPSDTDVDVLLDGVLTMHFSATAGRVQLLRLVPQGQHGTVEVRSNGGRTVTRSAYTRPSTTPLGTFSLAGRIGWAPQNGTLIDLNGSAALSSEVTLQAHADVLGNSGHVGATTTWVGTVQDLSAGASASWDDAGNVRQQYSVRAGRQFGTVRGGMYGVLSPGRPSESLLGLQASTPLGAAARLSAGTAYHLDGAWSLDAAAQWSPTQQTTVLASAQATLGGSVRVGVQVQFKPDEVTSITAQSQAVAGQLSTDVEYARQIGPDRLRVQVGLPKDARIDYEFNRVVKGNVSASANGTLAGHVGGSVLWVGGQVSAAADQATGSALLVHTGVPGMPMRVNGKPQGVTDAKGDVLISGLTPRTTVGVSVDPDDLPIELSYQRASFSLKLDQPGVSVYDWKDNFTRSHWVTLRWSNTEEAANAVLELTGGLQFYADGDGRVLIPERVDHGTLKSGSEARRCDVNVNSTSEVVVCGS